MAPRPGYDNCKALHRHAQRAWEDFEKLREGMAEDRWWPHEIEKRLHAISHHIRHTVYRSGVEINWGKPVRRSQQ
jgi:hypothetical protein